MENIFHAADDAAEEYGHEGDYVMPAPTSPASSRWPTP